MSETPDLPNLPSQAAILVPRGHRAELPNQAPPPRLGSPMKPEGSATLAFADL